MERCRIYDTTISTVKKLIFKVTGKIWLYPSDYARWHFVTIPKKESLEISKYYSELKKAWGSLPVTVTLGKTTWETSIFPDRKRLGHRPTHRSHRRG